MARMKEKHDWQDSVKAEIIDERPEWYRRYRAMFGKNLDWETWHDILTRRFKLTEADILATIEQLGESGSPPPDTVFEMRSCVDSFARRQYPERYAQIREHRDGCEVCLKGWVTYYPGLNVADLTPEEIYEETIYSQKQAIPCICKTGENVMETVKDYVGTTHHATQRFRHRRKLAYQQAATIQRKLT